MNLYKNFRKTALLAAVSVLALGAMQATAADTVADVGHVSVSVGTTLSITETSPIRFGNITVKAGAAAGDATVTMSAAGARSIAGANTDTVALLNGADNTTNGADDAGSETPGIYHILNTAGSATANIYITFSEAGTANAPIDAQHPTNVVDLTFGGEVFEVNNFTFAGFGGSVTGVDGTYGKYVTLAGNAADISVGADLKTKAGEVYTEGGYTGTFNIMASY